MSGVNRSLISYFTVLVLQIKAGEMELEALKNRNSALGTQIKETQEKYTEKIEELQVNYTSEIFMVSSLQISN